MTLGNRIRALRTAKDLSQPEMATLVGIEQSYLSKLENDKSIPSNEMFRQILSALKISLADFIEPIDLASEGQKLKQIPDVESYLNQKQQAHSQMRFKFLYTSCLMIVLSAAFFYAGFTKQIFTEEIYVYESEGVVLPGESQHVFSRWRFLIDESGEDFKQRLESKRLEMEQRRDFHTLHLEDYTGEFFREEVEGGTRFYFLDKTTEKPKLINGILQILAVMLLVAGVMGFVLERRISSMD